MPSAFSPNNDEINDIFKVIPVGIVQFNFFKIYNRWGKELFSTNDYRHGWDGTTNGKRQPEDIYIWTVSAIDFIGNQISKKGIVTLTR